MEKNKYDHSLIEKKWQEKWVAEGDYSVTEDKNKKKSYLLIEFPYPSGERLHVGHARSYSCMDAVARKRRMQGLNVLYPFGWDAFGLPAENYAIKTGIHPSITTAKNIENAKKQAISWGLSFDWSREVNTTDPKYYKWTQWIFIQLYKKGLAYKAEIPVNWCPSCKINLANEEVIDGKCERCGTQTERRKQSQWILKITEYAQRLLDDLETVDFRSDIKQQQINWIGRSEGMRIKFGDIEVFTTRPDTLNGATFVVLSVDHPKVGGLGQTKRGEGEKAKEGQFTGVYVTNPLTGKQIPVWVANYVTMDYGTGAIMGVPAHDERDMEFAKKYGLDIVEMEPDESLWGKIEKEGWGKKTVSYHLRDWVFSRQHYWGEPIPMVYCVKCAELGECWFSRNSGACPANWPAAGWYPVDEKDLPVELPKIEKYQPTETGESPLAAMKGWTEVSCPGCGGKARRETDTMPNWAGSSWYFLRYCDAHNDDKLADMDRLKYWLPVDWYNGGMEHTTLHLLYSRFWHKFLYDIGVVPTSEPYAKRSSHGVVLGPDGVKMSKSKGNVINPDEVVNKYGADALRMYEMFIGPFSQVVAWSWEGVEGVYRFLKRVWVLVNETDKKESAGVARAKMAKLVIKIDRDLEATKFNTAVAAVMEFVNFWMDNKKEVGLDVVRDFLKVLAPMAPFITEELWQRVGKKGESVHKQAWPTYDEGLVVEERVIMVVQVDGRVRDRLELKSGRAGEQEVEQLALESDKISKHLKGRKYRTVFVPGKVINFVTS